MGQTNWDGGSIIYHKKNLYLIVRVKFSCVGISFDKMHFICNWVVLSGF